MTKTRNYLKYKILGRKIHLGMFETDKNKLKFCALSLVLDVVGRMRENINFDVYEKEWQG